MNLKVNNLLTHHFKRAHISYWLRRNLSRDFFFRSFEKPELKLHFCFFWCHIRRIQAHLNSQLNYLSEHNYLLTISDVKHFTMIDIILFNAFRWPQWILVSINSNLFVILLKHDGLLKLQSYLVVTLGVNIDIVELVERDESLVLVFVRHIFKLFNFNFY